MNRRRHHCTTRTTLWAGLALASAATFATAGAARADLPTPFQVHREVHGHVIDLLRTLDRIPDRIERHHQRHLEVFFGGREYYGPHRHHHVTYRFPVWVGGLVDYRPYVYCGDHLFERTISRPRFWTDWGQAPHGAWCSHHGGYYPHAHACFRPRFEERRHRYDYNPRYDRRSYDRRYDRYRDHRCDDRCDHRRERRHDRRWDRRDGHVHHPGCDHWGHEDRKHERGHGRHRGHQDHDD